MPSFTALGHRWGSGSDDLGLPAALEAVGNCVWLGAAGTIYYRHRHGFHCLGGAYLDQFYCGGLLLSGLNLGLLAALIRVSLKGTVINTRPRRAAARLVGAKCCMDVLILVFSAASLRWAFMIDYTCEPYVVRTMQTMVKGLWASVISGFVSLSFILSPTRIKRHSENQQTSESVYSATRKAWQKRLGGISKLLGLEGHPAITSIANLFTDFFKEKADLVPSDLMVALMLLEQEQKARQEQAEWEVLGPGSAPPHHPRMRDWMNPSTAAHYMKFACGCYGWPMYVLSSPLAGAGLLRVLVRGRYVPRSLPPHVVEDNSLMANTTVIKMVTGLTDQDIVYATFHNKLFEIPFYVALDHQMKSIVVAIRGTLSLEDVLTDLMAFDNELFHLDGAPGASAHAGMLDTARYILRKLTGLDMQAQPVGSGETPLLDIAQQKLTTFVGPDLAKEYGLVVVGHSLGAGVAAILSLLLHGMPQYANVKCFAFSPPGGLLSQSAAEYAEPFVCSVILGDDIVGRLGLTSLFELKIRILQIIQNCDVKKHEVIGSWLINLLNHLLGTAKVKDIARSGPSWDGDPVAQKAVERFKMEMQRAIDSSESTIRRHCRMYPPGCVMYIREQKANRFIGGRTSYTAAFTGCDSPLFKEVLLSRDMIRHHMPWVVLSTLQQARLTL